MKRALVMGLGFLLLGMVGCSSPNAVELANQRIALMNEITTILDGIKDDSTATEAMPKLEKAVDRLVDLNKKAETVKASAEEFKQVQAKAGDFLGAGLKMTGASMKAILSAPTKGKEIEAQISKLNTAKK
jgi:hypothetical protein